MNILIQGAGIGGCAAALYLSKLGHQVTVVEKRSRIFTDGAGILLYSNALKYLDHIGVLDTVLAEGFCMTGQTEFYDINSVLMGQVQYDSIDAKYPSYVGINRTSLLKILYNQSLIAGATYHFECSIDLDTLTGTNKNPVGLTNGFSQVYDLIIACDGTNSLIRKKLIGNSDSIYTGYGVWHSMHKRRPEIKEKNVVVGNNCRIGFIPISNDYMYAWASMPEPEKIYIHKKDQPRIMREKFSCFGGFVGELINEINDSTHVHFTCVEEVNLSPPWHYGNVVFLGDSAHAALPFMAQGGAQALHDTVSLGQLLSKNYDLAQALHKYSETRYTVSKIVQDLSKSIGHGYRLPTVDLDKVKQGLDLFYKNTNNFLLPNEL